MKKIEARILRIENTNIFTKPPRIDDIGGSNLEPAAKVTFSGDGGEFTFVYRSGEFGELHYGRMYEVIIKEVGK